MRLAGLTINVHQSRRMGKSPILRWWCALVATGLGSVLMFAALCQPLHADPVYIGASGPTHSWASGWFEESHPHSPGTFDEMQLQIDTSRSPGATFEIGSSQLSPSWTVTYNKASELVAESNSPGGANATLFDLVFNNTPPSFVGIYFQLFNGNQVVESGYFYRGSANLIPGGQSVGGGWYYSTAIELPPERFTLSSEISASVPEPSVRVALLGLAAVGLLAGAQSWRPWLRGLRAA